jgi:Fe-S cluster assembly ATP-binding protein
VKLLEEIEPDQVHILVDGRIVHTANAELAQQIELDGYDAWRAVTT